MDAGRLLQTGNAGPPCQLVVDYGDGRGRVRGRQSLGGQNMVPRMAPLGGHNVVYVRLPSTPGRDCESLRRRCYVAWYRRVREPRMLELDPEDRFIEIGLQIVRCGSTSVTYDAQAGLSRRMFHHGHVRHYERDPRFEGKAVTVEFEAPANPVLAQKLKIAESVDSVCGLCSVRANVEPTETEKEVGQPPIHVRIAVPQDVFDAFSACTASALDHLGEVHATIRLVGDALPEIGSGPAAEPILLSDLDVSEDRTYGVTQMHIARTGGSKT